MNLNYTGLQSKIEGSLNSIEQAFKSVDTKFDWSKLMNTNYFKTINWTSLLGYLFTPANLISFFAAMGALGLTTGMQLQTATTTTPVGATLSTTDRQLFTDTAKTIASSTGQSSTDIVTAMEALYPALGDNAQSTMQLVQLLAQSAAATGQNVAQIGTPFAGLLQTLGITDLGTASDLLTALTNGASQAGVSIQDFIGQFQAFAPEVKNANLSTQGLVDTVRQFGASWEGAGVQGATEAFNALFKSLTSSDSSAIALANMSGGVAHLKSLIEDGKTASALGAIGTSVKTLAQGGQMSMLASEFGINAAGLAAFNGNLTAFPEAKMETLSTLFNKTATASRALAQNWEGLKNIAVDLFGGQTVINSITDLFTWTSKLLNLFTSNQDLLSTSPLGVFLGGLPAQIKLVETAFGSLETVIKDFLSLWQNTGGVSSLSANGGSNAVSTPKTAPGIPQTINIPITINQGGSSSSSVLSKQISNQANNQSANAGKIYSSPFLITAPLPKSQ